MLIARHATCSEKGFLRGTETPGAPNPQDKVASDRPAVTFWLEPGRVAHAAGLSHLLRGQRGPCTRLKSEGSSAGETELSVGAGPHPPSQVSLVDAKPRRRTERFPISPFFRLRTPSFPMGLWPRFKVSRLCV